LARVMVDEIFERVLMRCRCRIRWTYCLHMTAFTCIVTPKHNARYRIEGGKHQSYVEKPDTAAPDFEGSGICHPGGLFDRGGLCLSSGPGPLSRAGMGGCPADLAPGHATHRDGVLPDCGIRAKRLDRAVALRNLRRNPHVHLAGSSAGLDGGFPATGFQGRPLRVRRGRSQSGTGG